MERSEHKSSSEFVPANMPKLSKRILAYLMSREYINNPYPSPKHPENLFDIFGIGFGINSPKQLTLLLRSCRKLWAH